MDSNTLREVEARNLTDYLARSEHRHVVKAASLEHHGRLVNDFDKASNYYAAAREMASEAKDRAPQFTDKENINVEIYAETQIQDAERNRYLTLANSHDKSHELSTSTTLSR